MVSTYAGSGFAKAADGIGILASFDFPNAITTDGNGNLYVTEGQSNQVRKITASANTTALPCIGLAFGQQLPYYNQGTPVLAQMPIWPNGISYSKTGNNLYVSDYGNGWIELF